MTLSHDDLARHAALLTGCRRAFLSVGGSLAAGFGEVAEGDSDFAARVAAEGFVEETAPRLRAGLRLEGAGGALCVADDAARALTGAQRTELRALARQAAEALVAQGALDRLDLDFNAALDSLSDGLLTIGGDGALRAINAAAATMLGVTTARALGATLEKILPEEGGDALLDAILAPMDAEAAAPDRQVVGFQGRRLAVQSRAYRLRIGPEAGRLALTASLSDVTETERLAEAEAALARDIAAQHRALQTAYLQLEQSAARIRETARRIRVTRIAGVAGLALLVGGLAAYSLWPAADWGGAAPVVADGGLALAPQPVSARIAVVGLLDAGSLVSVVGPFDGLVQQRLFRYGGQVERGAALLQLDLKDVEVRLREARSAEIRARQKVAELRGWQTGFEVARARRAVAAAQLESADLAARAAQTRLLLSRGIIAADEHRALVQQQRSQQLQAQAAQNDLESTLARGDAQTLHIAELELANAEAKVAELDADLAQATVRAPVSGVVLMPPEPAGGGRRAETIEVGSRVSRGQTMFTIGALESFQVRALVDEIDVNKVRVGQAVAVTGDAFGGITLAGRVTAVAAQAGSDAGGRGTMPSFPVTVAIEGIAPEQRRQLAVGMSASLSIITYDKPDGYVAPPHFVHLDGAGQRVIRLRRDGVVREVPVELGISTPEGIELRGALQPGDVALP
ncbi:HlyD family efflux transporter periplasmic adaptor subunit [Roseomonas sp. 18066]|uniref:HlyD family efflux transporter periplasmic adaptor subunit n=1 Tax=Roseomonas sp. 18066 TaxID=2681412 RepID=UPI00135BE490|nr:HlyD family efflux transporter periplasmic adaptor subunit [Roseomonas sp. 18066]